MTARRGSAYTKTPEWVRVSNVPFGEIPEETQKRKYFFIHRDVCPKKQAWPLQMLDPHPWVQKSFHSAKEKRRVSFRKIKGRLGNCYWCHCSDVENRLVVSCLCCYCYPVLHEHWLLSSHQERTAIKPNCRLLSDIHARAISGFVRNLHKMLFGNLGKLLDQMFSYLIDSGNDFSLLAATKN